MHLLAHLKTKQKHQQQQQKYLLMSLKETDTDMYTDDPTLTAQAKTLPELEEKLNIDAGIVSDWCRENKKKHLKVK